MSAAFRWSIAAAMAAAASLAGPPAIAAPGDPVAFAKTLYAQPELWMSIGATPDNRGKFLTPALAKWVIDVNGDFVNMLEYDPLADSLPFQLSNETFTLVGSNDTAASVKVDFKSYDNPHTVTLKLVSSGDRWLLADIDFPNRGTLVAALQMAAMCL
jgi:hypothetical protein